MELNFKRKNKTLVVKIYGEIDHHTSQEIRRQIETALIEMGGRNIIFDFENVTFMDSSGIGMLIGRYKQLQIFNGKLSIYNANEKIEELIRLSGLIKLIPIFTDMNESLFYAEGGETNAV